MIGSKKFNKIILLKRGWENESFEEKKIRKAIARRTKEVEKYQVNKAWRNIFVQAGILK